MGRVTAETYPIPTRREVNCGGSLGKPCPYYLGCLWDHWGAGWSQERGVTPPLIETGGQTVLWRVERSVGEVHSGPLVTSPKNSVQPVDSVKVSGVPIGGEVVSSNSGIAGWMEGVIRME